MHVTASGAQMADDPGALERSRRALARLGWASAVFAAFAAGAAVALPDIAGVLVLAALVSTGTAALFLGGPAARAGGRYEPYIALLLAAGAAGIALAVAVDLVIAVGVVYVAYTGVLLIRARRRAAE
jgi:hypothetical protein